MHGVLLEIFLKKFNVKSDEIENAPLKTKIKRSECPEKPNEQLKTNYVQIISSIIYGYTHCRLDLAFPVNMLTRIMHSPDMATKILPAKTASIFSKIVLGMHDNSHCDTDTD